MKIQTFKPGDLVQAQTRLDSIELGIIFSITEPWRDRYVYRIYDFTKDRIERVDSLDIIDMIAIHDAVQ